MDFYKKISCYVMAADHESGSLPPIEALMAGRPIIARHVGMMPYVLKHGWGGMFIENNNELKDAMFEMKKNFNFYAEDARHFKLPDTTSKYEDSIRRVLE